jgi:hypothetical protein
MGSMTEVRPPASRPAGAGTRPLLVSVLAAGWFVLSAMGAAGAVRSLAGPAQTVVERTLAAAFLILAALFAAGAVGLLRKASGARALLATAGLLALVVSGFSFYRIVTAAAAPAVPLAASEPDAANALALFRAGSAVAFLVGAIPLVVALSLLRHRTVRDWANPHARVASVERRGPDALTLVVAGALAVGALSFFLSKKSPSSGVPAKQAQPALAPAETFLWSDQPVVFSPPPAPFTRERHAEGGRKGVSFTRYAVPPTRITVAEANLEPAPNTPEEALARLRLTNETFRSADSADVGEPAPLAVGNAPAFQTDYTIRERSMEHRGRQIVALAGRSVFVFTFLGRNADVPLFEALVASVSFPAPGGPEGAVRTARENAAPGQRPDAGATEIRVGEHRLTVSVPDGWERVDYGAKQEFRRGELRIALVDGGALPPGTGAANLEDEWLVQRALRLFGHDARRWEVASRTRVAAGDGEALVVDTREPLSHVFHARTVVFVSGGRLLAGGMVMGLPEEGRDALDALARSVRFPR